MWIAHKTKDKESLATIAKRYKIKDSKAITLYKSNNRYSKLLKSENELPKGIVVWVPDPKAKAFLVKGKKGEVVLDEKEYGRYLESVHRAMDMVHHEVRVALDGAYRMHERQLEFNRDQSWVAAIASKINPHNTPDSARRRVEKTHASFTSVVKARKYGEFDPLYRRVVKETNDYLVATKLWIEGQIAGAIVPYVALKYTKSAGQICMATAAVVATAPASLPAAILVGAGANAATGLAYDGAEQVGRAASGMELLSYKEMATKFLANGLTGAAGALVGGVLLKCCSKSLAKLVASNGWVANYASRMSNSGVANQVFKKELKNFIKELDRSGVGLSPDDFFNAISVDEISAKLIAKCLMELGTNGLNSAVDGSAEVQKLLEKWMKDNPDKLKGSDPAKAADAFAEVLAKSKAMDKIYDEMLQKQSSQLQSLIRKELEKHASQIAARK